MENNQPQIVYFGQTNFRNQMRKFGIKEDDRRRHMYVIGKTGMGKTTLLENMILSDIYLGHGCCYVDPHGDTAEKLIDYIPQWRLKDVVYFNPSDIDYPIGFNILESIDDNMKHLVAAGLMGVFKKIWEGVWSARMEYIMNNTILALMDTPNTTLLDINRMLSDKEYRNEIVNNVKDPIVKQFWIQEFGQYQDKFASEAVAPIQNKVGQFLSASIIRNIVAQTESSINFRELMDKKKILIVNLSKGRIGEDASRLLGGMMITKLQMTAMERVNIPEDQREDFFMYVDEFQNFAVESFASILSEARKYRLALVLAHQYIAQLTEEVRDAVFGNVGTIISFRVGSPDATFMEQEFAPRITPEDMINLPKYHIYLKLMIDGVTSQPFSATTLPPIAQRTNSTEAIINWTREQYSGKRHEIEERVKEWSGFGEDVDLDAKRKEVKDAQKQAKKDKYSHDYECTSCKTHFKLPVELDRSRPIYCEDCHKTMQEERKNGKKDEKKNKKERDKKKKVVSKPVKVKDGTIIPKKIKEETVSLAALKGGNAEKQVQEQHKNQKQVSYQKEKAEERLKALEMERPDKVNDKKELIQKRMEEGVVEKIELPQEKVSTQMPKEEIVVNVEEVPQIDEERLAFKASDPNKAFIEWMKNSSVESLKNEVKALKEDIRLYSESEEYASEREVLLSEARRDIDILQKELRYREENKESVSRSDELPSRGASLPAKDSAPVKDLEESSEKMSRLDLSQNDLMQNAFKNWLNKASMEALLNEEKALEEELTQYKEGEKEENQEVPIKEIQSDLASIHKRIAEMKGGDLVKRPAERGEGKDDIAEVEAGVVEAQKIQTGVSLARDLVNTPGQDTKNVSSTIVDKSDSINNAFTRWLSQSSTEVLQKEEKALKKDFSVYQDFDDSEEKVSLLQETQKDLKEIQKELKRRSFEDDMLKSDHSEDVSVEESFSSEDQEEQFVQKKSEDVMQNAFKNWMKKASVEALEKEQRALEVELSEHEQEGSSKNIMESVQSDLETIKKEIEKRQSSNQESVISSTKDLKQEDHSEYLENLEEENPEDSKQRTEDVFLVWLKGASTEALLKEQKALRQDVVKYEEMDKSDENRKTLLQETQADLKAIKEELNSRGGQKSDSKKASKKVELESTEKKRKRKRRRRPRGKNKESGTQGERSQRQSPSKDQVKNQEVKEQAGKNNGGAHSVPIRPGEVVKFDD